MNFSTSSIRPLVEIGSIVHYGARDVVGNSLMRLAAVVTAMHSDSLIVNLCVFLPSGVTTAKAYVLYSDELIDCRWSWPPSVIQKLELELRR